MGKNKRQTIYLYQRNGRFVIDGTSAVELDAVEDVVLGGSLHVVDRKKIEKKQRNTLLFTAARHLLVLLIVLSAAKGLFHYIELQQELTVAVREVGSLESQMTSLAISNDQRLNDIQNSVDLDEIKRRAMMDLGMSVAEQGQIVVYTADTANHVQQYMVVE